MEKLRKAATWYGNFVANSRIPTLPHARRLAQSNPTDYGIYMFWDMITHQLTLYGKNKQIKELKAEREELKAELKEARLLLWEKKVFG